MRVVHQDSCRKRDRWRISGPVLTPGNTKAPKNSGFGALSSITLMCVAPISPAGLGTIATIRVKCCSGAAQV